MPTGLRSDLDAPPDLSGWSAPSSHGASGPLSTQQLRKLTQANLQQKKVLRAAKIASFNGACTAVFAALALIGGIVSLLSMVMGLALAAVAYNELRGRNLLRKMDLSAPRVLAWNQLGFMALLIGYALWKIYFGLTGPSSFAGHPELETRFGIAELERMVTVSVYGSLIAAAIIFQGGCAWYYFTRTKYLTAYLTDTAPWIIDIQRATRGA